jgi:glutamine synthetase
MPTIEAFGESDFARRALGDHVFERLLKNKTIEYDDYRRHVTDFEMERYRAVL